MSDPKYVIITAANCAAVNRAGALDNMGGFAQELHDGTDVLAIRYGVVLSGLNPGALVFVQMYESLSGLEQAMEVISGSAAYASLLNDQNVQPYLRKIAKIASVPFDNASALPAKYLVFTRAKATKFTGQEMIGKVLASAPFLRPTVNDLLGLVRLCPAMMSGSIYFLSVISRCLPSSRRMAQWGRISISSICRQE